jgi:hypothetical protein
MNRVLCIRKHIGIFLILCVLLPGASETFRVRRTVFVSLAQETPVPLSINDALAVELPDDRTFLKGVMLDLVIPTEIASFPGAVAYSFYDNISPGPAEGRIDYDGTRILFEVLPPRMGLSIGIPYGTPSALKTNPYIRLVPFTLSSNSSLIFFRIQLVMKGVPENVLNSLITVAVKPVYEDRGRLSLKIIYPRDKNNVPIEKPYTVFIDEQAVELAGGVLILDSGVHHLSIVSDFYRNETRTVTVPKAKTLALEVPLTDIAPLLAVSAPDGTEVFFDGEKIDAYQKAFPIAPGDHTVRFLLGGYESIKSIHAVNGRTYSVSVDFNIEITENP